MGDVVQPPGRKGALSTPSANTLLPSTVYRLKRHRQNPCIHSQWDCKHPPEKPPSPDATPRPLRVIHSQFQCKLHPFHKTSTGIQSQTLAVPMHTGKHTVIGGKAPLQESHNPPGKKKHWTPYRRVSSQLLQPRSFPVFKNVFKSLPALPRPL